MTQEPIFDDTGRLPLLIARSASGAISRRPTALDLVSARPEPSSCPSGISASAVDVRLRLDRQLGGEPGMVVFAGLCDESWVTEVARDVATAFADARREPVLLVDLSSSERAVSNPAFADVPGEPESRPGLYDWIRGEASLDEVVRTVVPDALFHLPVGDRGPDPDGWLASASGSEAIAELEMQFGTVVGLSAPMGTTSGKIAASRARYVALVLERHRHPRTDVRAALSDLRSVGQSGAGVIFVD